jgi:hypothetical protein
VLRLVTRTNESWLEARVLPYLSSFFSECFASEDKKVDDDNKKEPTNRQDKAIASI